MLDRCRRQGPDAAFGSQDRGEEGRAGARSQGRWRGAARGQLNVTCEDKSPKRGWSLSHTHTCTHSCARTRCGLSAGHGWEEDVLQPAARSSFPRGPPQHRPPAVGGLGGSTGCPWIASPWLLWVKHPTCCFQKGWCAGRDLG